MHGQLLSECKKTRAILWLVIFLNIINNNNIGLKVALANTIGNVATVVTCAATVFPT